MRVTAHLPDKLAKEIKALAADEGVSVSRFIARCLEHYITENRKKKHAKNKGLTGIVQSRMISDAGGEIRTLTGTKPTGF
ncbi:MAG: hypothetical protein DRG59_08600 [Deltaproteobacteria bacterium]|nr:MAG: hypothetical protein DRG59_08600 [Deltaproteobacteria bacterium]